MEHRLYGKHIGQFTLRRVKDGTFVQLLNTFSTGVTDTDITNGVRNNVIEFPGFDKGVGRGSSVERIGNAGFEFSVKVLLYGLYDSQRQLLNNWCKNGDVLVCQLQDYKFATSTAETSGINPSSDVTAGFFVKILTATENQSQGNSSVNYTTSITLTLKEIPYKPKREKGTLANLKSLITKATDVIVTIENYITQANSAFTQANNTLIQATTTLSNIGQAFNDTADIIKDISRNLNTLIKTPETLAFQYNQVVSSLQKSFSSVSTIGNDDDANTKIYKVATDLSSYNNTIPALPPKLSVNGTQYANTQNTKQNIANGIATNFVKNLGFILLLTIYDNKIDLYRTEGEIDNAITTLEKYYDSIANINPHNGVVDDQNIANIYRFDTINKDFVYNAQIAYLGLIERLKAKYEIVSDIVVYISGKKTIWDIIMENYYFDIIQNGVPLTYVIESIVNANNLSYFDIIENQNLKLPSVLNYNA